MAFFRLFRSSALPDELEPDSDAPSDKEVEVIHNVYVPKYCVVGDHVEYAIVCTTARNTWVTYKRYQQFKTLDQKLREMCGKGPTPYHCERGVLPVLCISHWTQFVNQSPRLIEERRRFLEVYLQQLIVPSNRFFYYNSPLYTFLHRGATILSTRFFKALAGLQLAAPRSGGTDEEAHALARSLAVTGAEVAQRGEAVYEASLPPAVKEDAELSTVMDGPSEESEGGVGTSCGDSDWSRAICGHCQKTVDLSSRPRMICVEKEILCEKCSCEVNSVPVTLPESDSNDQGSPGVVTTSKQPAAGDDTENQVPDALQSSTGVLKITSLADFQLLTVIGRGTFGQMYRAYCIKDGKEYALKVQKKSLISKRGMVQFTREEKEILEKITPNPFVCRCFASFQTDHYLFFVLEYLPGGDLYTLSTRFQLHERGICFYLAEALLALEHCHSLDILHRDVKQENFVIDREGHLRLTDFGLGRMDISRVHRRSFVGSTEFIAPEVIKGEIQSAALDWWSYGIMAYDMLFGTPPFTRKTPGNVYATILTGKLEFVSKKHGEQVSAEACDFVAKLLQKDVESRLKDPDEMKKHPFFADICWEKLSEKELIPPFVPSLNQCDTRYASEECLAEWPIIPDDTSVSGEDAIGQLYIAFNNFPRVECGVNKCLPPPPAPDWLVGGCANVSGRSAEYVSQVLEGAWQLLSLVLVSVDGMICYPWGNVSGILIHDNLGTYSMQIAPTKRRAFNRMEIDRVSLTEMSKAFQSYLATSGDYTVSSSAPDNSCHILRYHIRMSLNPTIVGQQVSYLIQFEDENALKLTSVTSHTDSGVECRAVMRWRRQKN